MNQARRYVHRAPRYVLRPNDRHMVRYSPEHATGPAAIHKTNLLNFSESGLAIIVDADTNMHVGERLKVELPVPAGDQIAWWATVVRTELIEPHWWSSGSDALEEKILVALRFDDLPNAHRRAVRKGLEKKFIEDLKERRRTRLAYLYAFLIEHSVQIAIYAFCVLAAATILYWLAVPSPNYDPQHGAPWGHRFEFFDWQKDK